MRTVVLQPVFEEWRERARELLALRVPPGEVLWSEDAQDSELFEVMESAPTRGPVPKVPGAFLDLARRASAHRDGRRWGVLYRVLWRLTHGGERHLLSLPTDRDVHQLQQWQKTINRDIHKMHAFVRFRLVGRDEAADREQFVAWFEPEHRIVRLAAPFFEKRFAGMDWSILTPYECAHWDGCTLHFSPGVSRSNAPDEDALDELWRTYFRSIFNPARLKVQAMQAEMPKKYWKNLPEAPLIGELISGSGERVRQMMRTEAVPVRPAPKNAYLDHLRQLNETAPAPVEEEPPQNP
jgi:DNA polymerase